MIIDYDKEIDNKMLRYVTDRFETCPYGFVIYIKMWLI